jgi:hypothetical protein
MRLANYSVIVLVSHNNNNNNNNSNNLKAKMIPAITEATGTISKSYKNSSATSPESSTSRNYRKQPCWALHTFCGKY